MKLIEKLAEEAFQYDYNYTDKVPSNSESYRYGFEAGFRKARELFAEKYGDQADYLFSEDILKIGEEEC